jgi:hypothetical protein
MFFLCSADGEGAGRKGLKEPDPDMAVTGELYFNP